MIFGKSVCMAITDTGKGMNILLSGGDCAHIGAVSVAASGKVLHTTAFPGHREDVVCKKWAESISKVYAYPVVVEAGIHYDNISGAQIQTILDRLDRELEILTGEIKTGDLPQTEKRG